MNREDGQATVELVAALPALLLAAFIAFQLLAAGYATTLADGAAEAGALALASGRPAEGAVREALPGWAARDARVEVRGGRIEVGLLPPALPGLPAGGLAVTSEASAGLP